MNSVREYGDSWAAKFAKKLGMKFISGSGSSRQARYKGDAVNDEFVLEHKATESKSFSITHDIIMKLYRQANQASPHTPVFGLTFTNMPQPYSKQYILLRLDDFIAILEEISHD